MSPTARAGYLPTLAITVALACAAFLIVMPVVVLASRPQTAGLGAFAGLVNQQNQTAKTLLYLLTFAGILPVALLLVPRLADAIAQGPNGLALPALAAVVFAALAGLIVLLRVSGSLPWGDGLKATLAAAIVWSALTAGVLWRAARWAWPALSVLASPRATVAAWIVAAGLTVAGLLCVTHSGSLHLIPLLVGGVVTAGIVVDAALARRRSISSIGWLVDVAATILLVFAVPNLVIFHASHQLPNIYFPPGVIQNQQDYLLGSANQLLHGGTLLVDVPVSQYGVGLVYFITGWFHLVGIGYGTLGLLDAILTAVFYVGGYWLLRIAGVSRIVAVAALAVAVVGLLYGLQYVIGALPEAGPLRFGWPMALIVVAATGQRWPGHHALSGLAGAAVLGLTAIWGFEAFAYTAFVYGAIAATRAWLAPAGSRRGVLARAVILGVAACLLAHLLLAGITLLATGGLPEWSQYLAYLRSFLLGGEAGAISYGFARWSPVLAVFAAVLAGAAAVVLVMVRAPAAARRDPARLVALAGLTAYAIALMSYVDNRSSTYLLRYVGLPVVLAAAIGLSMLSEPELGLRAAGRRLGLGLAVMAAALIVSSAWGSIAGRFSQTALARARPGGGLVSAVDRLVHPPPIDPRAPEAVRLIRRHIPGRRALIVLPLGPDLAVETLMRSGRSSPLFISDPVDDSLIPSVYMPRLRAQITRLHAGMRLLIDLDTLRVAADLRRHPEIDPGAHPVDGGDQEDEWLLAELERRFVIRPVDSARDGLIVAELEPRGPLRRRAPALSRRSRYEPPGA